MAIDTTQGSIRGNEERVLETSAGLHLLLAGRTLEDGASHAALPPVDARGGGSGAHRDARRASRYCRRPSPCEQRGGGRTGRRRDGEKEIKGAELRGVVKVIHSYPRKWPPDAAVVVRFSIDETFTTFHGRSTGVGPMTCSDGR